MQEEESVESRLRKRVRVGNSTSHLSIKPHKRVDDAFLSEIIAFVKKQRSAAVTLDEKIDILLLQGKLRHEFETKQVDMRPGRKQARCRATERIVDLLHRRKAVVQQVWRDFVDEGIIRVSDAPANYTAEKNARLPKIKALVTAVQSFVRERRQSKMRTVARDVMLFCEQIGFLSIDYERPQSVAAALRSVQRFLLRHGYKRGTVQGKRCYKLREEIQIKRDLYVAKMMQAKAVHRRIVYLDESYIHQNYVRHDDSVYDPNDEQDMQIPISFKGRRFCFIAAIIDADYTAEDSERQRNHRAHLLSQTLDIFQGGKQQSKDYHGMFDASYFAAWMKKLLAALHEENVQNAIIVMDNASYHRALPVGTPKGTWKRNELLEACKQYNIIVEATDTKPIIWQKLQLHIRASIQPVAVAMAKEEGHEVVFIPPHHSDLQPIELVWAVVKGVVGRQYTSATTLKDVQMRLQTVFEELTSEQVRGCINKANERLEGIYKHMKLTESIDDGESDQELDSNIDDQSDSQSDYVESA